MSTLEVNKFDGNGDFRLWQVKIHSTLVDKGLDSVLEGGDPNMSDDEMKKLDKRALAVLRLALGGNVLR